jgi:mono/diheme cytochrome c family protein
MSKRTFIVFGLLVLVLAVVIPWVAFHSSGDANTGDQEVASDLKGGQSLFETNCGTCHTLYAAGTDGNYGPNLDELLAPSGPPAPGPTGQKAAEGVESIVLNAIENGVDSATPGRMPAGILNEQDAKEVAKFVGRVAGEG